MRKINFLLAGIATLFMASCSNDEPANNNGGENVKGGNESYLAIKIVNPTGSRAAVAPDYTDGTKEEAKVNDVVFYLFKDGQAFDILDADGKPTGKNKIVPDKPSLGTGDINNVTQIYNPVLVLRHKKGDIPNQIVAVANTDLGDNVATVTALKALVANYGTTTGGFIMTNAMVDGGELTPITQANLAASVDIAKNNPIRINIERVLARIDVTLANAADANGLWELAGETAGTEKLYAKLLSWAIHNEATTSHIIKNVDFGTATVDATTLPWTGWSSTDRSFWANATSDNVTIVTTYPNSWTSSNQTGSTYLQENTDQAHPTTLIVKAQIGTKNAAGELVPATVANWNGLRYVGEVKLKEAMLSFLAGQNINLVTKSEVDGGTAVNDITVDDIKFVNLTTDNDSYKVVPKLADGVTIYEKATDTTPMTTDKANELLEKNLGSALIWNSGMTYYQYAIKHEIEDAPEGTTGIVRNHVYQIKIKSVGGLGTPVYNPGGIIIPSEVEFEESSMFAEIRVLSWRVVTNDVDLGK